MVAVLVGFQYSMLLALIRHNRKVVGEVTPSYHHRLWAGLKNY